MKKRTFHVLIVDDDPADAEIIEEMLTDCDTPMTVSAVADGGEAMQFLQRLPPYAEAAMPDLVLLDLNMPRKDGREVLRDIRGSEALRKLPVLVLTTSQEPEEIDLAYELGANSYVSKPATMADFQKVIAAIELFWMSAASLPNIEH